ncbi:MAG: hypothetical protein ACFFD3_05220, partial [Candidatus Thorarchaeota archaeon]
MEDWQEETLRYFWRKMKIDDCLISEYYEQYGELKRDYAFPNGLFIKCKFERGGFPFAIVKFKTQKSGIELFDRLLRDHNSSREEHGWNIEYTINVSSQGSLMNVLWKLFEIDYAQYIPVLPQDSRMNCPQCKALIAYDDTTDALWLKCRNCGNEIFIGGQKYDFA